MQEVRGSQGIEVTFGSSESTCVDPFQQCLELHRGSSSSVSSGAETEDHLPPLQMEDSGSGTADSSRIRKLRSYLDRMSFLGDNTNKGERQMYEEREEDSTTSVMKLTSTKGIALLCSLAVTVVLCLLLLVFLGTGKQPKQKGGNNYLITTPIVPSAQPSAVPSSLPSPDPSFQPSAQPSVMPTSRPSPRPSSEPSYKPSLQPSAIPSSQPSFQPSSGPSFQPSAQPSVMPSGLPSSEPSYKPSLQPSAMPSSQPSTEPTSVPSSIPSEYPSANPSSLPSTIPSLSPSNQPTSVPSAARPEITTVVITGNSSSAPLITTGVAAFILLASAACYLRRRDNGSDDTLSLQCPTDGSDLVLGNSICYDNSSEKQKNTQTDLEEGRREPRSAYNKFMAGNINNILSVVSIAEIFTRQRDGESNQSSVANPEEVTPKACKPVRVISRLSPMFSPVREFSIKMNERKRRNLAAKNKSKSVLCLDSPPDRSILGYDMKKCISDSDSSEKVTKSSPAAYMNDGVKVKMEHGTEICETSLAAYQHSVPALSVDQEDSFQFKYIDDLINSSQEGGGFSFRDVYFDPENELYECQVSGSLGISVDATPLGLRVQKINPTSRLQNFISKGDIIVACDDVDLVGQETSVFWKLASQKSDLCLVVLKI